MDTITIGERIPSARAIVRAFTGSERIACITPTARVARELMAGTFDPAAFVRVRDWQRQAYGAPRQLERVLVALDELLGTHGVEAITGAPWHHWYGGVVASFLNTGDTYAMTLLRCHRTSRWLLTSWGDYVERYSKRYGIE